MKRLIPIRDLTITTVASTVSLILLPDASWEKNSYVYTLAGNTINGHGNPNSGLVKAIARPLLKTLHAKAEPEATAETTSVFQKQLVRRRSRRREGGDDVYLFM